MRPQKTNLLAFNNQGLLGIPLNLSILIFFFCNETLFSKNGIIYNSKTKISALVATEDNLLLDENNLQCNTSIPLISSNFATLTAQINDNVPSVFPLCLGGVTNISNLINNNLNDFTTISITGVGCNATIGARNNSGIPFPSGTWAGFRISSNSLLDVSVAATVTISTYNNNTFRESHVVSSSLIGIDSDLLNDDGTFNAGFLTTQTFNEIRITYSSLVGVLFAAQIYHPIVMNYCSASPPNCNTTNKLILPNYPVTVDSENTGINAVACVLCDIDNANYVIDSIESNYATINLTVGAIASGSISVKNVIDNFNAGTFAGFDIEHIGLLDVGILDAITISTYNNGVLQESKSGQENLILANTSLLTDDGRRIVGFLTEYTYDEIKLTVSNFVGIELSTVKVYGAIYESYCNGVLECNETYALIKPDRPVFINSERTGIQGVVSVGCSVANSINILDSDTTDYATITLSVGAISTGSISVKSATQVYPQGSKTGFAIKDINTFLQADVFEKITICTYLNGVVRECKSAGDLLDISLLSNIIGSGSGVYNIGFRTSLSYDEVTIEVGSLLSALNIIRVYGAFVDTRGSFGDVLNCCIASPSTSGESVCIGEDIDLNQIIDGVWTSTNEIIAVVGELGIVNTLSSGIVSLINTDSISGCVNDTIVVVTVNPRPVINLLGNDTICVGSTTLIENLVDGLLSSTNSGLVSISGDSLIIGLAAGTINLYLTDNLTGCVSDSSTEIVIVDLPIIDLGGVDSICEGGILDLGTNGNGSYTSSNSLIASVDLNGIVTGNLAGYVELSLTDENGCISLPSELEILSRATILLVGEDNICEGETTSLISTDFGTWVSSDTTVATINEFGEVLGIGTGTVSITLVNNNYCVSLSSDIITINPTPTAINLGHDSLCIGESTVLSASDVGTWVSSNQNIAFITNEGLITANNPGEATFLFTSSNAGCIADTLITITIHPSPTINIIEDAEVCIGESINLSATGGVGQWILSNTSIATIDENGVFTGLASGNVSVNFTNILTGCGSLISTEIMIFDKPIAEITGDLSICIGGTTTLSPALNGIWNATDSMVVSINAGGIVIGIGEGTSSFVFTESNTGCVSDTTIAITVMVGPQVSILGDTTLCIGETTQLSSNENGVWISSNPNIASVNNLGLVTALHNGQVQFSFISDSGCISNLTSIITIHNKPQTTISGNINLCLGQTINANPSIGGTWISTRPLIASISNAGLITALNPGTAKFIFTDAITGCLSDSNIQIVVNAPPVVVLQGNNQLCIGDHSQVSPTTQGIWISSKPSVISVTNSGYITAFTAGTANLTYISAITGCTSSTIDIIVNPKPLIQIIGDTEICVNANTSLIPSSGGNWFSNNPTVATIENNGVVTGVNQGSVKFYFISSTTGCKSSLSGTIIVNSNPYVNIVGPAEICVGISTQLIPSTGGLWTSLNASIATVDNSGKVIGINEGITSFKFTDSSTQCSSTFSDVEVNANDSIFLSGNREVCIGYNTSLIPISGGIFVSSNNSIATINNLGIIKGKAEGKVTFSFIRSLNGCISKLAGDSVEVFNCFDPDFIAALVNVNINGNLSTNDEPIGSVYYSNNHFVVSKPNSSIATLQVDNTGSFTFTANTPGEYIYQVPVCILPQSIGCPTSNLKITVVEQRDINNKLIVNTDIISLYHGNSATINTVANDDCVNIPDCVLDESSVEIVSGPYHGNASLQISGKIQYVPLQNYFGLDTLIYRVCSSNNPTICRTAIQIFNTKSSNASNTTVAYDDFYAVYGTALVLGNVLLNDSDPEGDLINVAPQGNINNRIAIPQGAYYLLNNGEFEFLPEKGFRGSLDIIYNICDDNVNQACVKATIHILVLGEMDIQVRAYLEGALIENGNSISSSGRPLMRDDLRHSTFTGQRHIPNFDPYKFQTEFTTPSIMYGHINNSSEFDSIGVNSLVFNVSGENAVVDWVYLELRDKKNKSNIKATRSALLQRDGDVVDLDGISPVRFPGILLDSFYVVLRHRTHLGVMSQLVASGNLVDFTSLFTPMFNFGIKNGFDYSNFSQNRNIKEGYAALWAGDANGDGKIKFHGAGNDINYCFADVLNYPTNINSNSNFDFSYGYFSGDFNMDGKSKFDNPFDDTNLLYGTTIFYPLNEQYLSNFDHFIEQVPTLGTEFIHSVTLKDK